MSARSILVAVAVSVTAAGAGFAAVARQEAPFPHIRHEGLFPLCTGCHEGIPSNDVADFYPEPGTCNGCHDGVAVRRVSWTPPEAEATNLRFTHDAHATLLAAAGDPTQACERCHAAPGGPRMSVTGEIQLQTCWSCHAHQANEHEVDAGCRTCHVPIVETGFGVARLERLPVPSDHEPAAWPNGDHGRAARRNLERCATCHTQERCVGCHVDTNRPSIRGLAPAPPGMELPSYVTHYNRPATHEDQGWLSGHGGQASRLACATCHTTDDCRACHVSPVPDVVASLPTRASVVAPGAGVTRRGPESHESLFFFESHSSLAASASDSCATCHQESFCVGCHDAPSGGGYHPPDFVATHPAEAFGRDVECASCHNTQVFCRGCHVDVGRAGARFGPSYHDSQPLWLIRHGQSARQALESCTSCHSQASCTRCHGTLGSFQVNPHSRDFDPEAAFARNPRPCFFCHVGDPRIGGQP